MVAFTYPHFRYPRRHPPEELRCTRKHDSKEITLPWGKVPEHFPYDWPCTSNKSLIPVFLVDQCMNSLLPR
jgi:hypothetical protein